MCSVPTMKFNGALEAAGAGAGAADTGEGVGIAEIVLSRAGPLSFSLCTYNVRMTKNCPVEAAISFKAFLAADGAALKLISITLRSISGGAGVADAFAAATLPGTDGVGVAATRLSSGTERR